MDLFDQGQTTLDRLLGYKLVVWPGLNRRGEGLTDADVNLLSSLHALGKSLYLLGPGVASDTARMTPAGRKEWERLCGLQAAGAMVSTANLETRDAGFGDPICKGRLGVVARAFRLSARVEPGRLVSTNDFETKVVLEGSPVMVVTPRVTDPDLGRGRVPIGRVIHSSRGVGCRDWIGGVALFNRALSAEELSGLSAISEHAPVSISK